jgi:hypothetical protein
MPLNDNFQGGYYPSSAGGATSAGAYGQAGSAPSSSSPPPSPSQNITPDFGPDAYDDGDPYEDD